MPYPSPNPAPPTCVHSWPRSRLKHGFANTEFELKKRNSGYQPVKPQLMRRRICAGCDASSRFFFFFFPYDFTPERERERKKNSPRMVLPLLLLPLDPLRSSRYLAHQAAARQLGSAINKLCLVLFFFLYKKYILLVELEHEEPGGGHMWRF